MEPEKLQIWANSHTPEDNLIWKRSYWNQIMFVRDRLPKAFTKNNMEYIQLVENITVISTHTSKSILLPVYHLTIPYIDLSIVIRNNFYDWKVTVTAPSKPLLLGNMFGNLFDPTITIPYYNCEGFPKDKVAGSFATNHQHFTSELGDDYDLYIFCWLIAQRLNN